MAIRLPEAAPSDAPAIGVIVGPTASGKSSLAVEVAERLEGEIVSADSQQLYRGFDLGTAKPTAEELKRVPHHLVSAIDPLEEMNAALFLRMAAEAIHQIRARKHFPIVVGGTGLYVRALLLGVVPLQPIDPQVRATLEEELERLGVEALRKRLEALDPATAASIPVRDEVRLIRALEIHAATGEAPSRVRARHGFSRFQFRAAVVGIAPPRETLYERIDRRTEAMFADGLVEEVRGLSAAGYSEAAPMGALGYRHAREVLGGRLSTSEAVTAACKDTRNYAKRQLTWFRGEPWIVWQPWPPSIERICSLFSVLRVV